MDGVKAKLACFGDQRIGTDKSVAPTLEEDCNALMLARANGSASFRPGVEVLHGRGCAHGTFTPGAHRDGVAVGLAD